MNSSTLRIATVGIALAFGIGAPSAAFARKPAPQITRHQWDTKGWVMLGEETVDPTRHSKHNRDGSDTDRITVGKYEGKFSKLQLVVDDSDMILNSMKIVFADNTEYNPKLAYEFKEGQRTKQFDLPPGEQRIQYIDLDYKNSGKRDHQNARVQIWGLQIATAPRPPVARYTWDNKGWALLGEQTVDYARKTRRNRDGSDTDRITVGEKNGRYAKLQLVVDDSDLTLINIRVTFGNKETFELKSGYDFKEGQRSRVIDLPNGNRIIDFIDLDYKNSGKRDGEKARVQVWGFTQAVAPIVKRYTWDTTGWQMLGEQTVDYARKTRRNRDGSDTDRITVGKYEGKFAKLQVVVDDSDMSLNNMKIVFADNTEYNPKLAYEFKEGQRTRVIDLPPSEQRIQYIDMDYKNSGKRDAEKARVQVWGYKLANAPTHRPRR